MSDPLRQRVIRLASTMPEGSRERNLLLAAIKGDISPMRNMSDYMDWFGRWMLTPHPAINDALGVEKKDLDIDNRVVGSTVDVGEYEVHGPGDTHVLITVHPDGVHQVEGKIRGQSFPTKRFRWRSAVMGFHRGTQGDVINYIEDNSPGTVVYKVYGLGAPQTFETREDLVQAHRQVGINYSGRPDLQGQPQLEGLVGPMWDGRKGDVASIRYETPEIYRHLST